LAHAAYGLRDRLIADPRFQRWSASFPLTRHIARKHEQALFDLCAGFVYSQTLAACVRLRVLDAVKDGPRPAADLARVMGLPPENAERLLKAAAALGLLRQSGDDYGLGLLGAAMQGDPGVAAMVEHHSALYADLHDPVALLRGEGRESLLARYWPYANGENAGLNAGDVAPYTSLMAASQPHVAAEALHAYPLRRHARVLDVGGGDGAFVSAAAKTAPNTRFTVFDLPPVAAKAQHRFAREGLRAEAIGGDFLRDPLPAGHDAITLVRILLDHGDAAVLTLLSAARQALFPGGTLVIAEPVSGVAPAPVSEAYFGLYLLAMGDGRCRTRAELFALLRDAGFTRMRLLRSRRPLIASVIVANP
jgi:demethylspheroidene O-methyltransferase